jgi:hypothetical protein
MKDKTEAFIGAAILAVTWLDLVPGDEIIGTPLGVAMILDGMGWL